MDYNLNFNEPQNAKKEMGKAIKKLFHFMGEYKKQLFLAFFIMLINSFLSLSTPRFLGYAIDHFIKLKNFDGLVHFCGIIVIVFFAWMLTEYLQTKIMGTVGQNILFKLRNEVFRKIQEMPMAFFNQNKSGDIISRINNDTDKINQFFAQSLMQFMDSIFTITGALFFLLGLNFKLGIVTILPAVGILLFSIIASPWVKRKNAASLKATGDLSAEVQEGLSNFKAVIAFNRRAYFRNQIGDANESNFKTALKAGIANGVFLPVYTLFSNIAQLLTLLFGIYLITKGQLTVGLLVSYIAYTTSFYNPIRQLAALWTNFQVAMAGWDRISKLLALETNLKMESFTNAPTNAALLKFEKVSFAYDANAKTLNAINLQFEPGKSYALVGPTGGGKTTTAYLLSRLYDPTDGSIFLKGRNLKSYSTEERTNTIGYILQDPYIFSGSLQDNIAFGNNKIANLGLADFKAHLEKEGFGKLLDRFKDEWENEKIESSTLSLGQKQIIAFIRAVLRKPELLILDEATANIDTVTENQLTEILDRLPVSTTKVIIAHRLNTIANADEIYFVNNGNLLNAGSLENAVKLIMEDKKAS